MEKALIEKIHSMLQSEDEEMITLGRRLFWMNDPSLEDYKYVAKREWSGSRTWEVHKRAILNNIEKYT